MSTTSISPPMEAPLYAVVGNPVAHSRSPAIHAQFAQQTSQPLHYTTLLAPLDGFTTTLGEWVKTHHARGCNVTVPFKFEAYSLAALHTPRATLAQAANTLVFPSADPATWLADNTDGAGLVRDITVNADTPLAGKRVLLVGAGGASSGVLGPLIAQSPATLVVANRSEDKAQALVARHQAWAAQHGVNLQACSLVDSTIMSTPFDVVINGTAASLGGGDVPIGASALRPGSLVIDMMYGPAAQPFLQWANAQGAITRDGLGMLVEQAAEAFYLWRGVRPDTAPVMSAMRSKG